MSEPSKRRRAQTALAALAAGSLLVAGLASASPATAAPPSTPQAEKGEKSRKHDFRSPMQKKQDGLRQRALEKVIAGETRGKGDNKVVKVGSGEYVELARESTDKIFVVLTEFGNARHSAYPDTSDAKSFEGPLHNQIPKPDRKVDNSTLWQADYDAAHYEDMYFNRMAEYYENQSSGRYSVEGDVTEWVRVPFNQARYGRSPDAATGCSSVTSCPNTWFLVRDALAFWVQDQLDQGKTMEQITAYLKTFDVQDRYDFDGDGDFKEPDGYIDHFQIVHAGGDQAAGDPTYGIDAIWSHRWYANVTPAPAGPVGGAPFGGTEIGQGGTSSGQTIPNHRTGVWVGDYTIQPENGGLGVFAHEFGHDLGLPDLYDTSGNSGGAENNTGFWSLMSSGANIGNGGRNGIGDHPTDMGTWEKLQLGWLDYDTASSNETSSHVVSPSVYNSTEAQAVLVELPEKEVPLDLGAPCAGCGTSYFYSDSGDNLNNTMTRVSTSGTALTAKVRYDIEEDWDYAFLEASTDNGASWLPVATNLSDTAGDQSGFNTSQTGITGTKADWTDLTATLPAGTNQIRFRYQTDGAFILSGFQVDQIAVDGTLVGTAETTSEGWTFDGFRITTGSEVEKFANYYLAENRQYISYDKSLKTAYNFGFLDTKPDWVENYPYQNGMLVNYWDTSQADNNVGDHPGQGLILPVDAHPDFYHSYDGHLIRPRTLAFDSTFGLEKTDAITVHKDSRPTKIPSRNAVRVFDDTKTWWFDADQHAATGSHVGRYQPGWYSVDVPKTGTLIKVDGVNKQGWMQISVSPK